MGGKAVLEPAASKEVKKAKVAFDIKLMRPGCAILQALFGAEPTIADKFDTKTWLVGPTPEMKAYEVTPEELKKLVQYVHAKAGI